MTKQYREWLTDHQIDQHIGATKRFAYVLTDDERRVDFRRQRDEAIKANASHDDHEGVEHADG